MDELLDTLRRDPEVALLHRMTRALFLAIMHRPLLRALYTADQEVLGRLAKGDDKALEIREEMAFSDYLGLLAEHGVLRADIAPEELAYAYRATVNGFILIESFIDENYQFDPERKADLLASTAKGRARRKAATLGHCAVYRPRVSEPFTEIAEVNRAKLRRATRKEVPSMPQLRRVRAQGCKTWNGIDHARQRSVWRDPKTGLWNVFRYEDVTAVLADYRTFSSDFSDVFPDQAELIEGNIVATDPPYHHRLRHLVSQGLHPCYRPAGRAYQSSPSSCWIRLGDEPRSNWSAISLTRCR